MRIMQRMDSSVLQDVGTGRDNRVFVVSKLAKSMVAISTEKAANMVGNVTVVNTENLTSVITRGEGRSLTDSTSTALLREHAVVAGESDAVVVPELAGAKFDLTISNQVGVKNSFHVWLKRIFGSSQLVRSAVADRNVGVHGSEVVLSATDGARSLLPDSAGFSIGAKRSTLDDNLRGLFYVVLESSPVIMGKCCTYLTSMRLTDEVRWRILEIGSKIFDGLADRAYMLLGANRWNLRARFPVLLKESLTYHQFAKFTLDFSWTFHKSIVSRFFVNASNFCKLTMPKVSLEFSL